MPKLDSLRFKYVEIDQQAVRAGRFRNTLIHTGQYVTYLNFYSKLLFEYYTSYVLQQLI